MTVIRNTFMNKIASFTSFALTLSVLMTGCSSDDVSPFAQGGGASSTNIISEKNFAVAFDEPNPGILDDDGWHGGVEVEIIIYAADRNNTTVTGNTIHIETEYGILSSNTCVIDPNGQCSVTWTSILSNIPGDLLNTVTAYTLGEESFVDLDGSGNFNDGDSFLYDSEEPYLDLDRNLAFTPGTDIPIDLDNSGATGTAHTPADGFYSGAGCTHSSLCAASSLTYIFDYSFMNLDARTPP